MKFRNIKSLSIGLLVAGTILLTGRTALAAPAQCAVKTFKGTVGPVNCSKQTDGIPDNIRAYLSQPQFNDKCYYVIYDISNPATANTPQVKEATCSTDEPFKDAGKQAVTRNTSVLNSCNQADNSSQDPNSGCVAAYINAAINFLSAGVVVIVIIMVIIGGVRYSAAGGDASKVQAAKQQIYNALLALVAYIFLYAFLQWIIPGGKF